jgi:hypothetical protein
MNSVRQREGETIIKARFFPVGECRLLTTIELLMETELRMKACLQTCSKSLYEVVLIEIFVYFQIHREIAYVNAWQVGHKLCFS